MANNVRELRPKTADSEKITINLGCVDLGQIDLLVQEGFTPIEPTLFGRPFAISSTAITMRSSSPSPDTNLSSDSDVTLAKTWKPYRPPARHFTSRFSASPASPTTFRRSWLCEPLPQYTSLGRWTSVLR